MLTLLVLALFAPPANAADTTTIELVSGNNLIGFGVLPSDPTIDETLSGVSQDVSFIKGETHFAARIDDVWVRNFDNFEHSLGYWINLNLTEPTELEIIGELTDPDIKIQLHEGSNLVHFACKEGVNIDDAIPDWALNDIQSIIGFGVLGTRINNTWEGNLEILEPNHGYYLEALTDLNNFHFVCPDSDTVDPHTYGCIDSFATNYDSEANVNDDSCLYDVPITWNPTPNDSNHFLFLHDVRINGEPIDPQGDAVCAHEDTTCLGFGYTRDGWTGLTAMNGLSQNTMTFTVFDASEEVEVELNVTNAPLFTNGAASYGGCTDPIALNYNPDVSFDIGNCVDCDVDSDCEASTTTCTPNVCEDHSCKAQALDCDDADPCTEDYCLEPGGCEHEAVLDSECSIKLGDHSIQPAVGCGCSSNPGDSNWPILGFLLMFFALCRQRSTLENRG